jgi:hypothetical protein
MLADWEREPRPFEPGSWSLDARIDHTLTIQVVKGLLRAVERSGLSSGIRGRLQARWGDLLGRPREAPRVFAQGRSRIVAKDVPLSGPRERCASP